MRWISFLILAYLVVAVHVGLGGYISWGQATPNLVLPVMVFVAINATREHALGGAFVLGLMQDFFAQTPPGLYAFSYGLIGLFIADARASVHRDHPLTHLFVTFAAALGVGAVFLFNEWSYPVLHGLVAPMPSIWRVLASALFTAALAPVLLYGLVQLKPVFAFRGGKSRYSELTARNQ